MTTPCRDYSAAPDPPKPSARLNQIPVPPADPSSESRPARTPPQVPPSWTNPSAGPVPVVVTLDRGTLASRPEVIEHLRSAGLTIPDRSVHDQLDCVSGSIEPSRISAVEAIPGVNFVSRSRSDYGFG